MGIQIFELKSFCSPRVKGWKDAISGRECQNQYPEGSEAWKEYRKGYESAEKYSGGGNNADCGDGMQT